MALIKSHAVGMEREEFWEVWTPHLEKSAAASGLLVVFLICELSLNFVTEDDRRETNVVFTLPDAETDKGACIELCRGVHTAQTQIPMQVSIVLCTQFISICIGLGAGQYE